MGITTKAMQLAGCLVVMFGVPADGLRESVDQHVAEAEARGDKCCCLAFPESLDTEPLGFGVPYLNTFGGTCYLKGNGYEIRVYTFSPWLLLSPGQKVQL